MSSIFILFHPLFALAALLGGFFLVLFVEWARGWMDHRREGARSEPCDALLTSMTCTEAASLTREGTQAPDIAQTDAVCSTDYPVWMNYDDR